VGSACRTPCFSTAYLIIALVSTLAVASDLSEGAVAVSLTIFVYDLIVAVYEDVLHGKRSTKWFRNVMLAIGALFIVLGLISVILGAIHYGPAKGTGRHLEVIFYFHWIIRTIQLILTLLLLGFAVAVLKILRDSKSLSGPTLRVAVFRFLAAAVILAGCAGNVPALLPDSSSCHLTYLCVK
jgi:hypothetical protein